MAATKRCGDCFGSGRLDADTLCVTCAGEGEVCAACGVAPYGPIGKEPSCDCPPPESDEDEHWFIRMHSAGAQ